MIYCVPIEIYPEEGMFIEELKYKDENDFEWRIARVENGFMVRFFGDKYFKEETIECWLPNGSCVRIKNTNCIFFKDSDFDTFCEVRNILKNGFTDDIWDVFTELFCERFTHNLEILESELI